MLQSQPTPHALDAIIAKERLTELIEVICLNPRTGAMVLMRLENGLTLYEIAEHFDITRQAVSYAFQQLDQDIVTAFPHLQERKDASTRLNSPRPRRRSEFAEHGHLAMSRRERRERNKALW